MLNYAINPTIEASEVLGLIKRADCAKSAEDAHRLVRIVPQANIVVAARDGQRLVGLARGLKELSGCCYLSDLLVDRDYHNQGIGEQLIRHVRTSVGKNALIVLVPSPEMAAYSTEIG
jgi:ribosomal protein S18 acetylase RimI-like enzyme